MTSTAQRLRQQRATERQATLFLGYHLGFGIMVLALALRGQVPWWLFAIHTLGAVSWLASSRSARAATEQLIDDLQHDAQQVFDTILQERLTAQDPPAHDPHERIRP